MAPPRFENRKLSKEKTKQKLSKKEYKSTHTSTAVVLIATAILAVLGAVYYKSFFNEHEEIRNTSMQYSSKQATDTSNGRQDDVNIDFKILPRLNGVKVSRRNALTLSIQ